MSGSRHHFIPRFLQKGFSSRSTNKDVYCWTFSKDTKPIQPNIKNVGIETLFYSMAAETDLDDKISKEEQDNFSPLVDKLRTGCVSEDDTVRIAAMLAHFEIRSQHLRSNARVLFSELMGTLVTTFTNVSFLEGLFTKVMSLESAMFRKSLLKAGISKKLFKQIMKTKPQAVREFKEKAARDVAIAVYEQREIIPLMIAEAVKKGHIRVLSESISPKQRVSKYLKLDFSVQDFASGDLPLGDSIVLFHVAGERKFKPFLDKTDELIAVVLPLSSNQYLVGKSCKVDIEQHSDLALEIARCSFEYFISSRNNELTKNLHSEIGANSHWLPKQEIHKIFTDSLDKVLDS
ncbi:DUF4238 domain-containing protein [Pseudomonas iridis]